MRVQGFGEDYEKIYNAVRGLPVRACVVAFALRMGRRRCFACICVGDAQDQEIRWCQERGRAS